MSSNLMKTQTLVFIPAPAKGHLVPTKALINLLLHLHKHLHISIIIMDNTPFDLDFGTTFINSLSNPRLHFFHLHLDPSTISTTTTGLVPMVDLIHLHRPQLKQALLSIPSPTALILDIFCSSILDIVYDLSIPPYIFLSSSAISLAFIPFFYHLSQTHPHPHLLQEHLTHLIKSETLISLSTIKQPVPARLIPPAMNDKSLLHFFLNLKETIKNAKGMLVNSFSELEPYAFESISDMGMAVYPVGPLVEEEEEEEEKKEEEKMEVIRWLDEQPNSSVVFLCFGSLGRLSDSQVKEVAVGLEKSRHRFLWSLPRNGEDGEILPEGFLERTKGVGRVIGWAPQMAVLRHSSVGGFVSHCGWNSTLESIYNGVPMATWPLYGEQHVNAYWLVRELGVAVEMTMNNSMCDEVGVVVTAEVVQKVIGVLMEEGGEQTRKKMKLVQTEMKKAMLGEGDGGSGSRSLGLRRFLCDLTLDGE